MISLAYVQTWKWIYEEFNFSKPASVYTKPVYTNGFSRIISI